MRHKLGESFPFLPRRSKPWIGIAKPTQSSVEKFIGGRGLPTGALSIEGPAKNKLRRSIMFRSHPQEPLINQGRLPRTTPGNDGNDIYLLICPGLIQESDIRLSAKKIASCNGESRY